MDIHPKNTQDNVAIDQSNFDNIQINSFRQMVDNGLVTKRVAEIQRKKIFIYSMKVKKIGYKNKNDRNFFIFRQFIIDTNRLI